MEEIKRPTRRWVKALRTLLIIFLAIVATVGGCISLIATPEFLTPRVLAVAKQSVKSEFSLSSVDLSLLDHFPNITLRIDSLRITQTKEDIDDLLFVRECQIAVNPLPLLFKKLVVSQLTLQDAKAYIYVDSLHGPLKCFNMPGAPEVVAEETPESEFDMSDYQLLLRRVVVDSVEVVVNDRTKDFYTQVRDFNLDMSLGLSSKISGMRINTGFENLLVWHKGDILVKKTKAQVSSKVLFDRDSMKLSFKDADLQLNGINFTSSGEVSQNQVTQNINVDITSSLSTPSLAEFLSLIPSTMIDNKDKITTEGSVALDFNIQGEYSDESFPTLYANIKVDNAKARYASRKLSLENVNCEGDVYVDFNAPELSFADIKKLEINTSNIIELSARGRVNNIIEAPRVDLTMRSNIDFDRFTEVFPLNEGIICSGRNVSDIKTQFALSDVVNANYANLYINGESTFHDLELAYDASKFAQDSLATAYLYMKAKEGKMLFGDRVFADNNSRTLRSSINFSNLSYKAKSGEYLDIQDIELTMGANFNRRTSEMNGIGVRGIAKNTNVGIDSLISANLESSDITFSIAPENSKHNTLIDFKMSSSHITAQESNFNSKLSLSSVTTNLNMKKIATKNWEVAGSASFSDYLMYTDIFPLDVSIPSTSVTIDNKTIYLTNASMKVGASEMVATGHINNLIWKMFVEPRAELSGNLSITSPIIDISELIEASNKSYMLFEQSTTAAPANGQVADTLELTIQSDSTIKVDTETLAEAQAETLAETETLADATEPAPEPLADSIMQPLATVDSAVAEPVVEDRVADTAVNSETDTLSTTDTLSRRGRREPPQSNTGALFLVPRRVNFVFDLKVDKALFENAVIEDVEGRAIVNKGVLTLEKLKLKAIGADAYGSMIYRNVRGLGANVAFNMDLAGADINRIGELVPTIGTMFPMLESFKGIVDFSIKANANILSDMEIDVSSLRSAMMFKGRDLVLMDSETFAELSKTLMFKNKKRNLINSIEAYALVNQTKVDVLPFSMSIDRYSAIIGGSQTIDPKTFDVDYKYNVSIMKSPLPFKAGVDIKGDLNDFDFKVTNAKLKNTNFKKQRMIYEEYRDSIK